MLATDLEEGTLNSYKKFTRRRTSRIAILIVALFILVIICIPIGAADQISIWDAFMALFGSGERWKLDVIWSMRLPRIAAAIFGGAGLAVSGVVMQALLRNPLAESFTLGISGAAAFGAAFAILFLGAGALNTSSSDAVMIFNPYTAAVSAFLWAAISTSVVIVISKLKRPTPEIMILAGLALESGFIAALEMLQFFGDLMQLSAIVHWTFGDLGRADWEQVLILILVLLPCILYFMKSSWNYNAMDLGDETAKSLGVNVDRTRVLGMVLASLIAAVVVAFFGIIGFVGLAVPHIVRGLIGTDERYLIPATTIFGAFFLLVADTVARMVVAPLVLPVGILTAFVGGPIFIYIVLKGRSLDDIGSQEC